MRPKRKGPRDRSLSERLFYGTIYLSFTKKSMFDQIPEQKDITPSSAKSPIEGDVAPISSQMPQTPQAPPPPPKSKGVKLGLIVLIIFLVVIAGGIIFYYVSKKNDTNIPNQIAVTQPQTTEDQIQKDVKDILPDDTEEPADTNATTLDDADHNLDAFCEQFAAKAPQICDSDKDGLPNALEESLETDMNNPDSDGDGYLDGAEYFGFYNPLGEGRLGEDVYGDCPDNDKSCLIDSAVGYQNVSICDRIEDADYKLECPSLVEGYKAQMVMAHAVIALDISLCDNIKLTDTQDSAQEDCRQKVEIKKAVVSLNAQNCLLPGIDLESTGKFNSGLLTVDQVAVADCVGFIGGLLQDDTACSVFTLQRVHDECEKTRLVNN